MKINSYYRQTWAPLGIDPDIFETKLGRGIESEAKQSLDKLISEPMNLTDQDTATLLVYLELQRIRVPRQADIAKKLMRDVLLRLAPIDIQSEISSGKFLLTIKDAARFDLMRMAIGSMSPWFGSMEWEVVQAEPGTAFITTDSPVSFYNASIPPPAEAGLAYAGTMVFFPLSSKYALVMRHHEYKVDSTLSSLDVLPTPEFNDGHIPIIHGGVWKRDVVDSFNWKMSKLSQKLIVGCGEEVLLRCRQIQPHY